MKKSLIMKKTMLITLLVLIALLLTSTVVFAYKPVRVDSAKNKTGGENTSCTKIQDGTLKASDGTPITTGYDKWGYNYQAHMFKGGYCDAYRDAAWCQPYKDDTLIMKWNDAWLANVDCDGDSLLDRHYGFQSYIGSGAWLTNHQSGEYEQDGNVCRWNYFVKIVAAPANATLKDGVWTSEKGLEIGPAIWGEFAVIQEVTNDPCGGSHGLSYKSKAPSGFGFYKR